MQRCAAVESKVVQSYHLYHNGPYGPEVLIELTDGALFNNCLKSSTLVEAKLLRKTSDEAEVLQDFSATV